MSTRSSDIITRTEDYNHPYKRYLKKTFTISIDKTEITPDAFTLQQLINADDRDGYRETKRLLEHKGKSFRVIDMVVYEVTGIAEEDKEIPVMVQVKGHSITWYFVLPPSYKDRYPQKFRDVLFDSAAEAHQQVKRGCDLYYRGSNAFHVKTMHTSETEAHWNHNHYRMADNQPVTPIDFQQHMLGFNGTLAMHEEATQEGAFFIEGEIEDICIDFEQWYQQWTYTGPEREESYASIYYNLPQNQINKVDVIEFYLFGQQQEPCRINPSELKNDYENARHLIEQQFEELEDTIENRQMLVLELQKVATEYKKILEFRSIGGSRGLSSEFANTRQIPDSSLPVIPHVADKDDSLGLVPQIPQWAIHARENMLRTLLIIQETADLDTTEQIEEQIKEFGQIVKKEEEATRTSIQLSSVSSSMFHPSSVTKSETVHESEGGLSSTLDSSNPDDSSSGTSKKDSSSPNG